MKKFFAAIIMGSVFFSLSAAEGKGDIKVVVERFGKIKGDVKIAVYRSKEGFPDNAAKAVTTASVAVTDSTVTYSFKEMNYGEYAVGIYYDENSNGKMDTGLLGIPTEGFGASNNPKAKMGPPAYKDSKFFLAEKEREVRIEITGIKKD